MKEDWKECIIGDICSKITSGGTPKSSNTSFYGGSIPWLNTKEVNFNRIYSTEKTISQVGYDNSSAKWIPKNSVIVAMYGATAGRVAISKIELTTNQACCNLIIDSNKADYNFIYYHLCNSYLHLSSLANGGAQQNLNANQIREYPINLPSLPTQQKIATILSSLDDKIELNNKINTNLEQQIEALLLNYLSKRETTSVKLGDYLYIKGRIGWKGLKKNEYLSESNYRIINGETLTKSGIDWNKAGYISEERYTESPEIMLQVGDILLSKDGTIGKIGYVDELELPTSVASGIFVIRNNNPSVISTTFIYYLLKSKLFDSFIIARTEGSVIPHLYQKDFMDFEFPLPSPELMNDFEQITSPMFNQIINNLKENKKLISLRDSLLPKLMNGAIEV